MRFPPHRYQLRKELEVPHWLCQRHPRKNTRHKKKGRLKPHRPRLDDCKPHDTSMTEATLLEADLYEETQEVDATVYYNRKSSGLGIKKDHGFTVLRWGSTKRDTNSKLDIVPANFKIQRELEFKCEHPYHFAFFSGHEDGEDSLKLFLSVNRKATYTIQFQTRFTTQKGMQYAVRAG